jgi:GT2 family glycosyltransferase
MTPAVPTHDAPELSVVMVTHDAWPLIERAVVALVEHTSAAIELIVIDNASDEGTRVQLSAVEGARVTLNDRNLSFATAVNQGGAQARGELLLLLNSDAFVHPGWLEPLRETLARPGIEVAVPRCVHPDGLLQEAGALLARDGTVYLYGDGAAPDDPRYAFWRTVDFGSAVCMLTRTATFRELGGFDESYAPAYYEDADFCMRVTARGGAIGYDPGATVTHVRYGSGDGEAARQHSERNRLLFSERWGQRLRRRPASFQHATARTVIVARDALAWPRFLICSGSGEAEASELVLELLRSWPQARITWATGSRPGFDPAPWRRRGVEVLDQNPLWLEGRLFHYDIVVAGAQTRASLRDALARSQPQAARFALDQLGARLIPTLAAAGIAPVTEGR